MIDELKLQTDVSLNAFTTYKIGGPAKYFAEIESEEHLKSCLLWAQAKQIAIFVLGKGSNLVVSDRGFDGLVLYIGPKKFGAIEIEGATLKAQAGALLHTVVGQSVKAGLAGMENLGGIPGTVGGGVYINAGAFDQELVQTISKVISIDKKGTIHTRSNAECGFRYRHSNFFDFDEIILSAEFSLTPKDPNELHTQMHEILKRRKEKQPLEYPNAGSLFKRPPGTYAGKLIEEAGLKGFQMNGAQISPKHANFSINTGNATAQDVYDLCHEVITRVQMSSGITLEAEQIFIGDFLAWPRA